jgi:hypothetical protein
MDQPGLERKNMEISGSMAARLQEATGFFKATTPPPTSGGHARGRGH